MSGAQVKMALKPSRGLRDDIRMAGGMPKDHAKENYKRLKEMQSLKREEEMEKSKPPPAPFKLKRFEAIKSKLSTHRPNSSNTSDAASDAFSRPSTANSGAARSASCFSNGSASTSTRNFIQLNAQKAKDPYFYQNKRDGGESEAGGSVYSRRSTKMGELPK
ncbi:UNVERIFIED_CONTAM: hypothetical protein HDU68_009087 [Siphonaria sp. JEL0065]|nr:hypothetical protein HDU68_009087 [Siphonaria sp. JEL0065]